MMLEKKHKRKSNHQTSNHPYRVLIILCGGPRSGKEIHYLA